MTTLEFNSSLKRSFKVKTPQCFAFSAQFQYALYPTPTNRKQPTISMKILSKQFPLANKYIYIFWFRNVKY